MQVVVPWPWSQSPGPTKSGNKTSNPYSTDASENSQTDAHLWPILCENANELLWAHFTVVLEKS